MTTELATEVENKPVGLKLSKEFATAIVKFRAALKAALKDARNPFFNTSYADLEAIIEAARQPLADNGLAYLTFMHESVASARVETILLHESGETFSCGIVDVPVIKKDAQGFGSAMTYARRYSLQAALGVPASDDDGNAAAKAPPKEPTRAEPTKVKQPKKGAMPGPVYYSIPNIDREQQLFMEKRGGQWDEEHGAWVVPVDLGPKLEKFKVTPGEDDIPAEWSDKVEEANI